MIKSLLICDDVPSINYGTGQRLLSLREALSNLGECRVLYLSRGGRPTELRDIDFIAPIPFDFRSSRWQWLFRHLTFAEYRPDNRYFSILHDIRKQFPYDIAFCSFFRTTCVAPTTEVPCFLDVDAIPERKGIASRFLWPLTILMMRRRVKAFRSIFVIRDSDRRLLRNVNTKVVPGISVTAKLYNQNNDIKPNVLFVGSMNWPPNREAVDWLLSIGVPEALWELGYTLRLAGGGTDAFPERSGLSGGGFVENLYEEYANAEIVICPVMTGGGANIKLAEAVQSGCAVLASAHASSAYDGFLRKGLHLEIFHHRSEFLHKLVNLLSNSERKNQLRHDCRVAANQYFNQELINVILRDQIRETLGAELV